MHDLLRDPLNRRILTLLQADAKLPVTEIAEQVGLSHTPCLRRIRLMEEAGLVAGYIAVVDQRAAGLPISVFVSIKMESQHEEALTAFEQAIRAWPEVMDCYLMTGPRDYLLRIVCADLDGYERFLKEKLTRVRGVASIESSFALNQVKHATALPLGG